MAHHLDFKISHQYQTVKGGISIPAILLSGNNKVGCEAKIDTGAEFCVFQRDVADSLGIKLESGHLLMMETLTGVFKAYGHEVTLITLDLAFDVMVYFAADYARSRNLLGRNSCNRCV